MRKKIFVLGFAVLSIVSYSAARAADHDHHAALFLGATTGSGHTNFTTGLDYEYRFHPTWGIGLLGDVAWSNPAHTIVGLPIFVHPVDGWKVFAAPGMSIVSGHSHYNTRVGTGYDFHLDDAWSLGPAAAVDIGESAPHWVYGVSLGLGF